MCICVFKYNKGVLKPTDTFFFPNVVMFINANQGNFVPWAQWTLKYFGQPFFSAFKSKPDIQIVAWGKKEKKREKSLIVHRWRNNLNSLVGN